MTQEPRNSYLWTVGVPVYMPDDNDVESVKTNMGFMPHDKILIDSGFWNEEECLAFRIFLQGVSSAMDNPQAFLESYRAEKENRTKPAKSSIIVPEQKGIITNF